MLILPSLSPSLRPAGLLDCWLVERKKQKKQTMHRTAPQCNAMLPVLMHVRLPNQPASPPNARTVPTLLSATPTYPYTTQYSTTQCSVVVWVVRSCSSSPSHPCTALPQPSALSLRPCIKGVHPKAQEADPPNDGHSPLTNPCGQQPAPHHSQTSTQCVTNQAS